MSYKHNQREREIERDEIHDGDFEIPEGRWHLYNVISEKWEINEMAPMLVLTHCLVRSPGLPAGGGEQAEPKRLSELRVSWEYGGDQGCQNQQDRLLGSGEAPLPRELLRSAAGPPWVLSWVLVTAYYNGWPGCLLPVASNAVCTRVTGAHSALIWYRLDFKKIEWFFSYVY